MFPLPKLLMPAANESVVEKDCNIKDYVSWLLTEAQNQGKNDGQFAIIPENMVNKMSKKKKKAKKKEGEELKEEEQEEGGKKESPEQGYINDEGSGYANVLNLATIDSQSGNQDRVSYATLVLAHDLESDIDANEKRGASCYFIVLLYMLYGREFCDLYKELRVILSALMYRYIFLLQ